MVFNTASVGSAVTPAVIQTFLSHYLNRKPLAQKPTAHISYDEGLHLIRQFLIYASHHTVEDIQRFTAQWVPCPRWVKVDSVPIPAEYLTKGAEAIQGQLGHHGIEIVGGKTWWQWRRPGSEMKAEWIEMRAQYNERKRSSTESKRVMLYVHGGAYFFGSTDEHRYQMQRHARKLQARVFARMLVIMRDQGIPLPAGAILISPWVDLTHSFPSVARDNPLDYIPPHGFHQRPSAAWPPPNTDDMLKIEEGMVKKLAHDKNKKNSQQLEADAVQGFHVDKQPEAGIQNANAATAGALPQPTANTVPGPGRNLSILMNGTVVEIKDQIHMYASNQLISHPLVSPVLQPSLGGLPPLLILTGGGEMLRDEQIYLAHKAANPSKYPPGDAFLDATPHDHLRDQIQKWQPTDVQLQVWEDLCHVAPTLSFTRPAKYMYRSIAQFGAWALARAQKTEIEILDDDDVSVISNSDTDSNDDGVEATEKAAAAKMAAGQVGKAGDPLPVFKNHMIRQRVDRHGNTYHLEKEAELPACCLKPGEIGVIKEGPVRKWIAARKEWDTKFASAKRRVQKTRAREIATGYQGFEGGEVPPPSALAGRRKIGETLKEQKHSRSWGMSLWALWGSKHDEKAVELEQDADNQPETTVATEADGAGARALHDTKTATGKKLDIKDISSRSRSRHRMVSDLNQTGNSNKIDENTPASELIAIKNAQTGHNSPDPLVPNFVRQEREYADLPASPGTPAILVRTPTHESEGKRPKAGGVAFPFSLKGHHASASMTTLTSTVGIPPTNDIRTESAMAHGIPQDDKVNTAALEDSDVDRDGAATPVVENGQVVAAERPPLETFVTAEDDLPTASARN